MKTKLMSKGNTKISNDILVFSTTPGTKGTCSQDCRGCYSKKALIYTKVQRAWARNTALAKRFPHRLEEHLIAQIKGTRYVQAVRIHSSGDFFSRDYLDLWIRVAKRFPGIRFYGYTKEPWVSDVKLPRNMVIFASHVLGMCWNYGEEGLMKSIHKAFQKETFLCPAKGRGKWCGVRCSLCLKRTKGTPLFIEH